MTLFLLQLSLFAFFSCNTKQDLVSSSDTTEQDSAALHIGVLPVMDCLPIYYAQKEGFFAKEGVDVRLHDFLSQMDCDTAMIGGSVDLAYTDIARALLMKQKVRAICSLPGSMSLITAHSKRIRQSKHLVERMVAVDRMSRADYLSDEIMRQEDLDPTAIYRPQINDIRLRTSMLDEQLLDAAILPEPYSQWMEIKGNRRLYTPADSSPALACMIAKETTLEDSLRNKQIELFLVAYQKAVNDLNKRQVHQNVIYDILRESYSIPKEICDSIHLPKLPHAKPISTDEVNTMSTWLKLRERPIKSSRAEQLPYNKYFNK